MIMTRVTVIRMPMIPRPHPRNAPEHAQKHPEHQKHDHPGNQRPKHPRPAQPPRQYRRDHSSGEAILSIEGVRAVDLRANADRGELLSIECQVDARDGVEAAIARTVATRWSLHRLERQQPTLENIFLRYISETPDVKEAA